MGPMRLIVGGLSLAAAAQGLVSSAEPAVAPVKADKAPIKIDKAAYTKEWHTEWKQGKVPSWKETYPKAALPYEDSQSDGKIGFLQAKPKAAVKADKAPIKIDKAAYTKEWHKEWKQGEVPSWKETYPKAALPYEDRQSDGKISLSQAKPKAAAKADKAPVKIDKAAYTKEWHKEWKQGEVPSWKETYPKAALPYEDRQSDGKIGTFVQADDDAADDEDDEDVDVLEQAQLDEMDDSALLQADDNDDSEETDESEEVATDEADEETEETEEAEDPVKADKAPTKIDEAAYAKEWHKEWKQGDVPSWKEFYPKSAHAFEDRQSDGEIDN